MSDKIPTKKKGSNKINPKNLAKVSNLKSVADTTVIPKPYKVTTKEIDNTPKFGMGLSATDVADSTRQKISYNLGKVIPSVIKRNTEREKEGKKSIPLTSIVGKTYGGFSNVGKSFKEAPIKTVKSSKNNK